ncbi:hypothetical protein F511_04423 [Dorcoceras hygrometricum]|uniref:Uncharacterized protein n=1 Tax=Dorcoceras hygrometricum TaxID=472368 RepID=A0A2Z7DCM4_9LAMI|nr:hypothetical protein F511_04423 [Dorcoceras hygrometricum]
MLCATAEASNTATGILRLDASACDWMCKACVWMNKLPADSCDCFLKPSAEYDDVINANPSAESSSLHLFCALLLLRFFAPGCFALLLKLQILRLESCVWMLQLATGCAKLASG